MSSCQCKKIRSKVEEVEDGLKDLYASTIKEMRQAEEYLESQKRFQSILIDLNRTIWAYPAGLASDGIEEIRIEIERLPWHDRKIATRILEEILEIKEKWNGLESGTRL